MSVLGMLMGDGGARVLMGDGAPKLVLMGNVGGLWSILMSDGEWHGEGLIQLTIVTIVTIVTLLTLTGANLNRCIESV
jgi:hypothetical protein